MISQTTKKNLNRTEKIGGCKNINFIIIHELLLCENKSKSATVPTLHYNKTEANRKKRIA
jgi:hypothetical protein